MNNNKIIVNTTIHRRGFEPEKRHDVVNYYRTTDPDAPKSDVSFIFVKDEKLTGDRLEAFVAIMTVFEREFGESAVSYLWKSDLWKTEWHWVGEVRDDTPGDAVASAVRRAVLFNDSAIFVYSKRHGFIIREMTIEEILAWNRLPGFCYD